MGASISLYIKDEEKIYLVQGSERFSGVILSYKEDDDYIGSDLFTDAVEINNTQPKPLIDINKYICTIIKESESIRSFIKSN